jgi:phosphoribosylformimino-5-aminoimidazole carboxamide ribotide isomerase
MQIIPVLDIMNGSAVRAIAGKRAAYRPLQSRWTNSVAPLHLIDALRDAFQPPAFYIADLDAIQTSTVGLSRYAMLRQYAACPVWLDAGALDASSARVLNQLGYGFVAGLESYPDPTPLRPTIDALGSDRLLFSLDLRDGEPLQHWPDAATPLAIVEAAYAMGVRRLLVLDLARVGTGVGPGPLDLLADLRMRFPDLTLLAGGGVQGEADLHTLAACGVDAVLVGSALHDGRLTPAIVRAFNEANRVAASRSTQADRTEPDCS